MNYYDIISKEQPIAVPFGEGEGAPAINLVYNRAFFCEKNSPRAKDKDPDMTFIDYIIWCFSSGLIVSWDLKLGSKAKPIPLTDEALRGIYSPLLIKIYRALEADAAKLNDGSF